MYIPAFACSRARLCFVFRVAVVEIKSYEYSQKKSVEVIVGSCKDAAQKPPFFQALPTGGDTEVDPYPISSGLGMSQCLPGGTGNCC